MGAIADAIETAHDGTDACADDDIRLHACLFKHLQYPDMSCTFRATATQNKGESPTPVLRRKWGICSPWWGRSHAGGCSEDPSRPSRLRARLCRFRSEAEKEGGEGLTGQDGDWVICY